MRDDLAQRKRALRSRLLALDRAMRSVQPAAATPSPRSVERPTLHPRWPDATAVGEAIAGHVLEWAALAGARWSAAFVGQRHEPDTVPLIRALQARGIVVWLPRIVSGDALAFAPAGHERTWVANALGIFEPAPQPGLDRELAAIDPGDPGIVFVPGMAFSRSGARIGRGRGYYDRALAGLDGQVSRITTVGLARARLVDPDEGAIAEGPHDRRVHWLVTEDGIERSRADSHPTPT